MNQEQEPQNTEEETLAAEEERLAAEKEEKKQAKREKKAEKKEKEKKKKQKKAKKARKKRPRRSPKEFAALVAGCMSLAFAVLDVLALFFLSEIVAIVLAVCAIIAAFISLGMGKGGTLPAVVGLVAGFLSILAVIAMIQLSA